MVGAFLAVPILATAKILCDHFESLGLLGRFLGNEPTASRREKGAAKPSSA
nr:MetaGeneMark_Unknown Function [uncultured bacterium]